MKFWTAAVGALIIFGQAAWAQDDAGAALAERYGLSGWGQIEQIDFQFNVRRPNKDQPVVRYWSWNVREGTVSRTVGDETITVPTDPAELVYSSHSDAEKVHAQFINDTYWLLFPFQLVWSDPLVTDEGTQPLPIGGGEATKLISQWPAEGGYTPGDAYDLYLGEDELVQQWVFRRDGGEKGRPMTWEDHQQLGPIIVSLDHYNADRSFRLWFTDVKATLVDGPVVTPVPLDEPAASEGVESE